MRIAAVMPGNLGCYKVCIDSIMKNIIKPNNADVFILTSKRDYYHLTEEDSFEGGKHNFSVGEEDLDVIKECFGSSLKWIEFIEDIPHYTDEMARQIKLLDQRTSWWNDLGKFTHFVDREKKKIKDGRNYLDRFLRMRILLEKVEEYERRNNFKYDYIIRFRIDQLFNLRIVIEKFPETEELHSLNMDCFWHATAKTAKEILSNSVEEIGKYPNDCVTDIGDYRLGRDMQFREYIKTLPCTLKPLEMGIGITIAKEDLRIFIADQQTEPQRKKENKTFKEYYPNYIVRNGYPIIKKEWPYIWIYTYFQRGAK